MVFGIYFVLTKNSHSKPLWLWFSIKIRR